MVNVEPGWKTTRVCLWDWALSDCHLALPSFSCLCLQDHRPSSSAFLLFAPIYLSLVVLRRYNLVWCCAKAHWGFTQPTKEWLCSISRRAGKQDTGQERPPNTSLHLRAPSTRARNMENCWKRTQRRNKIELIFQNPTRNCQKIKAGSQRSNKRSETFYKLRQQRNCRIHELQFMQTLKSLGMGWDGDCDRSHVPPSAARIHAKQAAWKAYGSFNLNWFQGWLFLQVPPRIKCKFSLEKFIFNSDFK